MPSVLIPEAWENVFRAVRGREEVSPDALFVKGGVSADDKEDEDLVSLAALLRSKAAAYEKDVGFYYGMFPGEEEE